MRPSKFEYRRAGSVAEAVQLLSANSGAKALAGGHSLIPAMNLRLAQPDVLVDLGRLDELKTISVGGNTLTIGALCTHAQIAASADVQKHCPALAGAAAHIGDPQVRNWGTLGGNLAHADPASDPPTVVLACNATIQVQGSKGARSIPAADFFVDLLTTSLQPGELITAVSVPSLQGMRSAYAKMAHPASRYAVVGVCVTLDMKGSQCQQARVAVGGATAKATRSAGAEAALRGAAINDTTLDAAANALMQDIKGAVLGDMYAPEAYRLAMAGVYFKRAVRSALA